MIIDALNLSHKVDTKEEWQRSEIGPKMLVENTWPKVSDGLFVIWHIGFLPYNDIHLKSKDAQMNPKHIHFQLLRLLRNSVSELCSTAHHLSVAFLSAQKPIFQAAGSVYHCI